MCSSMCDDSTACAVASTNGIPWLRSQNTNRPSLSGPVARSPTLVCRSSARSTGSGNQRTSRWAEASMPIQPDATCTGPEPRFNLTGFAGFCRGRSRAPIATTRSAQSSIVSIMSLTSAPPRLTLGHTLPRPTSHSAPQECSFDTFACPRGTETDWRSHESRVLDGTIDVCRSPTESLNCRTRASSSPAAQE